MNIEDYISIDDLAQFVADGYTDAQISSPLKERNPGVRGLSDRSVRRCRVEHGIHPT